MSLCGMEDDQSLILENFQEIFLNVEYWQETPFLLYEQRPQS